MRTECRQTQKGNCGTVFLDTAGAQEFCFALISPWACLIHHELRFQLLKSSYLYVMLAAFKLVPFIYFERKTVCMLSGFQIFSSFSKLNRFYKSTKVSDEKQLFDILYTRRK